MGGHKWESKHKKNLCTVYCWQVNSESTNRCLFGNFYTYVNFLVHSGYEFREILTGLYNWTRNFSAANRVTYMKMNVWLQRIAALQTLNCDSSTKFNAGGRSAQTFPLVQVFSATYEQRICSATCRQNIWNKVDVSMNINTVPSLLRNCRKLFLYVFYFFCNGWSNMEKIAKTALCRFWAKSSKSTPSHIRTVGRSRRRPPIII